MNERIFMPFRHEGEMFWAPPTSLSTTNEQLFWYVMDTSQKHITHHLIDALTPHHNPPHPDAWEKKK